MYGHKCTQTDTDQFAPAENLSWQTFCHFISLESYKSVNNDSAHAGLPLIICWSPMLIADAVQLLLCVLLCWSFLISCLVDVEINRLVFWGRQRSNCNIPDVKVAFNSSFFNWVWRPSRRGRSPHLSLFSALKSKTFNFLQHNPFPIRICLIRVIVFRLQLRDECSWYCSITVDLCCKHSWTLNILGCWIS